MEEKWIRIFLLLYIKIISSLSMAVDSKICVLYLFSNGDNVTNAFTGVSSSSGAPIRSLIFQSCNPYGPGPSPVFLEGFFLNDIEASFKVSATFIADSPRYIVIVYFYHSLNFLADSFYYLQKIVCTTLVHFEEKSTMSDLPYL